jgi:hypothetical protein
LGGLTTMKIHKYLMSQTTAINNKRIILLVIYIYEFLARQRVLFLVVSGQLIALHAFHYLAKIITNVVFELAALFCSVSNGFMKYIETLQNI